MNLFVKALAAIALVSFVSGLGCTSFALHHDLEDLNANDRIRVTTVDGTKTEMLVVSATRDSLVGNTPSGRIELASNDTREVWIDKGHKGEVIFWTAIFGGLLIFLAVVLSDSPG